MKNARSRHAGFAWLVAVFCSVLLAGEGSPQTAFKDREFLNLGSTEGYLNYGRKEYDPYPTVITARSKYDRLGNFQVRGYKVFDWELSRPGFSSIDTRRDQYLGWFNDLIILTDSYRGWNYAATIGEDIRTKLTDLTLSDPRWYGMRLDGASSDNKFTLLLSQGGAMGNVPKFSTFQSTTEQSPVLMFGGHWETNLGSVLQVGATYFNQHMADTFNGNGSFFKGDTPYSMLPPTSITVVIEDDSPERPETPAMVYGVQVVISGESGGVPVRLTSSQDLVASDPTLRYDATLKPQVAGGAVQADGGRRVAGSPNDAGQRVTYTFTMPEFVLPDDQSYSNNPNGQMGGITLRSVRFYADVAGDYRIGIRQQYAMFDPTVYQKNTDKLAAGDKEYAPGGTKYVNPFTGLKGKDALLTPAQAAAAGKGTFKAWPVQPDPANAQVNPFLDYKWNAQSPADVSYTVVRSSGFNAARRVVAFNYGIPTGQALYGMNAKLDLKGLTVNGEFVANPQEFIFPVGSDAGERFAKRRWAYFLNASKRVRSFELGGELFNLDPDYSGNYDSVRGGIPFFSDRTQVGSKMQEMYVMTDNDDNDQWPDESVNELPSAQKMDSGIFPGLDENQDLVSDSDQNNNGIPDWKEPVISYDADPPEFVYGIDFNNNGVPDFRENDDQPDYPYRRDRRGLHFFAYKDHLGPLGKYVSAGWYSMKEPAAGNTAKAVYGQYEYEVMSPIVGSLKINDDVKWVKDSIRDNVYIWRDLTDARIPNPYPGLYTATISEQDLNSQIFPPTADPLTMRNSLVNTVFVQSRFTQVNNLEVVDNLQWIRNSQGATQFDDGTSQPDNLLSTFTMVNKAAYTFQAGDLMVRPMFKHLLMRSYSDALKKATGEGSSQSFSILTPNVRAKFTLTPKSMLEMGWQGVPFLKQMYIDRVDKTKNYSQWTAIFMMTNRSDYYGYNLASSFGWQRSNKKFDDATMQGSNESNSMLFFDVIAGF